jgi:D-beta-D-heptose 7-phosphate kinase / D-beta-D-heptose 1-phosphate adenosyltransferase
MIDFNGKVPKILVIGDLIVDHYLWGSCDRISPEAPVQVVNVKKESVVLGGAGNVINNLQSLGAHVDILSVIGVCKVSKELTEMIKDIKVDTKYLITQDDRITSKKTRIIAAHQQVVRYDIESNKEIDNNSQTSLLQTFNEVIKSFDLVLLSDYGKGILTFDLTQSIIKSAKQNQKKVLVDPKGKNYSKYKGAYLLTPNKKEASEATNIPITDNKALSSALLALKKKCELSISIITLSEEGVAIFDDELRILPTAAKEVFDVTGAGDTILASLGFAISCDIEINKAVQFANLASGVVVGKIGSATVTLNEIFDYESSLKKSYSNEHIKSWDEIDQIVREFKNKDKKIVFTNGCFDILHIGHVKYLEKSKSFGDILILGLNSDDSVRRIKGQNRPINTETDRAYILASLEVVDYLVIFDESTPINLIKLIEPDVLVKGGDYEGKKIVGEEIAKELKLVKFIDNNSTTKIIERIQKK